MRPEDPQNNLEFLKKMAGKKKLHSSEERNQAIKNTYGNIRELQELVGENIKVYAEKMSSFLNKISTMQLEAAIKRYNELIALRYHITKRSLKEIGQFEDEEKRGGEGESGQTEKDSQCQDGKDRIKTKLLVGILFFNYLERESPLIKRIADADEAKRRKDASGKTQRKKAEQGDNNFYNTLNAEAHQYIASGLIFDPKSTLTEIKKYEIIARKKYQVDDKEFQDFIKGAFGLAGGYYFYKNQGYEVFFPAVSMDTKRATDLLAVDFTGASESQREEIGRSGFQSGDGLPFEVKKRILKIQMKCCGYSEEPVAELIYDRQRNSVYAGQKNFQQNIPLYEVNGENDWRGQEEKGGADAYNFFRYQCKERGFGGRFSSLSLAQALEYISNKGRKEETQ